MLNAMLYVWHTLSSLNLTTALAYNYPHFIGKENEAKNKVGRLSKVNTAMKLSPKKVKLPPNTCIFFFLTSLLEYNCFTVLC